MSQNLPPGFELAACAQCGSDKFKKLFTARDLMYGAPGTFTVSKCRKCGLVMQNPRPVRERIGEYYSAAYEPHTLVANRDDIEKVVDGQESRRAILEKHASKGRALDVGSGDGRFLLCLRRGGWEVAGCELVERAATMQKEEFGLDVKCGSLISAAFPSGYFDAVTFWSVFEHLYDPLETLVEAVRILKPGGKIVMSLPNFDSLERHVFRGCWFSLSLPYHIFHYTPDTLGKFVEKAGLEVEMVYYATTATSLIQSIKLSAFSLRRNKSVTGESRPDVPLAQSEEAVQSNSGIMKRLLFNHGIVPALKMADTLRIGAYTNFVFVKRN